MVSLLWCFSVPAVQLARAQAAEQDTRYKDFVREAAREYADGNYVEARALFEQAHALKPSARTLRGLGSCAYELKHYSQAVSEFEAALRESSNPLTAEQRAEVSSALAKTRRFVGTIIVDVQPNNASVEIDGDAIAGKELVLDAGDHKLVATAPGYHGSEKTISVEGGQSRRTSVHLLRIDIGPEQVATAQARESAQASSEPGMPRADHGEHSSLLSKWWFWTALGVVVAGAVTGTMLALESGDSKQAMPNAGTSRVLLQVP